MHMQVLGEYHPATLASSSSLGQMLRAQGDLPGAYIYVHVHVQVHMYMHACRG